MREKLIELLETVVSPNELLCCGEVLVSTSRVADHLIANNVVPVVRCKDCGGWCRNVGIKDSPNGHCFTHDIDTNGFDFCSYGERKDK